MKLGLPLKLAIGIIVVFGLLLAGMALYMPFWYRYRLYQLRSDDAGKRETASDAVAIRGKSAMPYIKEWLKSKGDKTFAGACLVLEKMEGETWKQALPELERVLEGHPSDKTNAAAELVFDKEYDCTYVMEYHRGRGRECPSELKWKHYSNEPAIKRNICIFILNKEADPVLRIRAVEQLIVVGCRFSAESLINAARIDSDSEVRRYAAWALGEIGDKCAVNILINLLENESVSEIRESAASALGKIGDSRAFGPLLAALENDSDCSVQGEAAEALGAIGDTSAVEPLIHALKNAPNCLVHTPAAFALSAIGDHRAVTPLIEDIVNASSHHYRETLAISLAFFKDERVDTALMSVRQKKDITSAIVLGWRNGDTDLEYTNGIDNSEYYSRHLLDTAWARWGCLNSLKKVLETLHAQYFHYWLEPFQVDIIARMPDGFPEYDIKANRTMRKKQAAAMKEWYQKHKKRLVWNGKERRYYLRD
jgi:HEAT repeat protein